jgi:hypothetical protein
VAVLVLVSNANAQTCVRYQDFEGRWKGSVNSETIEYRYPNPMLRVPEQFNPDHRLLDVIWRGTYYEVAWNLVQGESVPSLTETAQIGEDTDGYCRQVRQQSHLPEDTKSLRINIQGNYDNGGVWVLFQTRTCCFLYSTHEMNCAGATHYETQAQGQQRPWYNGVWYANFKLEPRPNDCAE